MSPSPVYADYFPRRHELEIQISQFSTYASNQLRRRPPEFPQIERKSVSNNSGTNDDDKVDDSLASKVNAEAGSESIPSTTVAYGRRGTGLPGSQTGGKKLAIIFTCTVCNTRAAKQFTEHAYNKGVVLVKCPGCGNQHLIADNLSMFTDSTDDGWNIEKAMKKIGQNVKTVTDDNVLELTMDEVAGTDQWHERHDLDDKMK